MSSDRKAYVSGTKRKQRVPLSLWYISYNTASHPTIHLCSVIYDYNIHTLIKDWCQSCFHLQKYRWYIKWYVADSNVGITASGTFFVQVYIGSCALLGYYAAGSGNSLPTFRKNLSVPSLRVKTSWYLKMGPIDCLETSLRNYHSTLRSNLRRGRFSSTSWRKPEITHRFVLSSAKQLRFI
jgi:hypothetical protein